MEKITDHHVDKLERLANKYAKHECTFVLPPFDGDINECAFDIHKLKENKPKFNKFLDDLSYIAKRYEYAKYNNKIFLVVNIYELL